VNVRSLLEALTRGEVDVPTALRELSKPPIEDLDFATLDHHRALRCGNAEVVFAEGKTVEHAVAIASKLAERKHPVLLTRCSPEQLAALSEAFGDRALLHATSRVALIDAPPPRTDGPLVSVVCAGTSDLPVLEEACLTLRAMNIRHERIVDVGVAGVHRLIARAGELQQSCAIVAIAGMEGALPTAVGGLVACPVFAVPTSVGYGTSLSGLAALLGMMSSCASNVSVVNIDNGFGAACCAAAVARQCEASSRPKSS
jgi:pyridinium-3,5-biscarboxylic acid mononucleotide synthase